MINPTTINRRKFLSTSAVFGAALVTLPRSFAVNADKKGEVEAKDELVLKCGSASITLKSNGDITIKGNNVSGTASGQLKLKGSRIGDN